MDRDDQRGKQPLSSRAMACNAPREGRFRWQHRPFEICNLQTTRDRQQFESHSLRQSSVSIFLSFSRLVARSDFSSPTRTLRSNFSANSRVLAVPPTLGDISVRHSPAIPADRNLRYALANAIVAGVRSSSVPGEREPTAWHFQVPRAARLSVRRCQRARSRHAFRVDADRVRRPRR